MVLAARGHEAVLGEQLQSGPLEEVAVDLLGGSGVEDQEPRGRLRSRVQPVIRLGDLGEQTDVAALQIVGVALEAPDRAVHGREPPRGERRRQRPVGEGGTRLSQAQAPTRTANAP